MRSAPKGLVASAAVCALILSGCGGDSDAESPSGAGTLRLAVAAEPTTLNPNLSTASETLEIAGVWAEGLVTLDETGQPVPQLAESWDISDDGLAYTFHLRQDVKWHDGEAFDSDDVAFTLENLLETSPLGARFVAYVDSISADDEFTVTVNLNKPFAAIMTGLSDAGVIILPEHIYGEGEVTNNPANLEPVGTGPFEFDSWTRGQSLRFVANDDYWGGEPKLSAVTYQVLPDDSSRINALRSGEVDILTSDQVPTAQIAIVEDDKNLVRFDAHKAPDMTHIGFNTQGGPLADVELRRAIVQGIDREQLIETVYGGHGDLPIGPIPEAFDALVDTEHTYESAYPFDPDAAREVIQERAGGEVSLRFVGQANPQTQALGNFLKAQLAEVGVDVEVVQQDDESFLDTVYAKKNFDIFYTHYTSFWDPGLGLNRMYLCSSVGVEFGNGSGYCEEEADAAMAAADAATTVEERKAAYSTLTELVVRDIPVLVTTNIHDYSVGNASIGGLEEQYTLGGGYPNFTDISK